MSNATRYTGHGANTGGLQGHSIGGTYPIGTFAQETPNGTRYGVMNFASGTVLAQGFTSSALSHAWARQINAGRLNVAAQIKRIITQGGHHA